MLAGTLWPLEPRPAVHQVEGPGPLIGDHHLQLVGVDDGVEMPHQGSGGAGDTGRGDRCDRGTDGNEQEGERKYPISIPTRSDPRLSG